MLPWECGLSDNQPQDGMLLPMRGETTWMRPEGRKAYFVGHVKTLNYELLTWSIHSIAAMGPDSV